MMMMVTMRKNVYWTVWVRLDQATPSTFLWREVKENFYTILYARIFQPITQLLEDLLDDDIDLVNQHPALDAYLRWVE